MTESLDAQNFRVKTEVFAEQQRQPIAENLSLFTNDAVYDFSLKGGDTIVFEPGRGRFILLDDARQMKTEMPLEVLGRYVADLQAEGVKGDKKFLYDPQFAVSYLGVRRKLELTSDHIIYRAVGAQPPAEFANAVTRFRQFTDWTARLNATPPGTMLPFARLELNSELHSRQLIPEEVEVVYISPTQPSQRVTYRSKQAFTWELTAQDQQRLDDVQDQLAKFKFVEWSQFRTDKK
ncbi:MAG: hypothetical protein RIC55_27435 [Pirellulaceae bacterium]